MGRYHVSVSVDGFYEWYGEAENSEEAQKLALDAAGEADFGELENIDWEVSWCSVN